MRPPGWPFSCRACGAWSIAPVSGVQNTVQPQRSAMGAASPMWSPWAWLMSMCVASTSAARMAAVRLFVRNGSRMSVCAPACTRKQAWPRKVSFTVFSCSCSRVCGAVSPQAAGFVLKFIEKSSFACG